MTNDEKEQAWLRLECLKIAKGYGPQYMKLGQHYDTAEYIYDWATKTTTERKTEP